TQSVNSPVSSAASTASEAKAQRSTLRLLTASAGAATCGYGGAGNWFIEPVRVAPRRRVGRRAAARERLALRVQVEQKDQEAADDQDDDEPDDGHESHAGASRGRRRRVVGRGRVDGRARARRLRRGG